jgi:hypothetical protein
VLARRRAGGCDRLIAVEGQWRCAPFAVARTTGKQRADQLPGTAELGCGGFVTRLAALCRTAGNDRQGQLAIALGDFEFDCVAALGGKGQGERHIALVDQRAVGAVGKQRLDFGQQPLAGDQPG